MNHFLDIGANVGNTFDWYLMKTTDYDGWHVWCFEPSIRHLEALRARCSQIMANNEHNYTITICPFALSDFTGYSKIFETVDSLGDSLNETSYTRPFEILCGVMHAAEFIADMIPPPERMVLKVDPEGSEIKILNSILQSHFRSIVERIDKILVEFHDVTMPFYDEMCARIKSENIPIELWTL